MNPVRRYCWIIGFRSILFLLTLFLPSLANAQIPRQLSYHGFLSEASGKPMIGSHSITFRLYDDSSSGNKLWEEIHQISLSKGIFQVILGVKEPLNVNFDRPLWVSLEVNQEGEMTPRIPLVSVGYAFNASALDSVPASHFLRLDRGGEIQGALSVKGMLLVQGRPVMLWDRRSVMMVGLVSFACGALGGILVFTLARLLTPTTRS